MQGRYEVGLPWIRSKSDILDHFNLCYNRLRYLQRRLIKQSEILKEYQGTIDEQLRYNIIKPVDNSNESSDKFIHYMPHHAVVKQGRITTKVRVIYDGSATSHECNIVLNDCLQVGPNLIPKLFNVLIRFRCYQVALTGDIEKAFLMISIRESDRDMLRFFGLKTLFKRAVNFYTFDVLD